jgi:hypothetical protein
MVRRHLAGLFFALAGLAGSIPPVAAEEPPHPTFAPAPPGTVVQSQLVYLAGEAMHSQWRGVLSQKAVGNDGTRTFYQWYLSIYRLEGTTYKLRYRSPGGRGGPFSTVTKVHGVNMWFPLQDATIVGAGELMREGVQNLVVASHESAADCGGATITIFGYDGQKNAVVREATVGNGCDLDAKIIAGANTSLASLKLIGPYYGPGAPLCCPTRPEAIATLRYMSHKWIQTPAYYTLDASTLNL